MHYTAMQAAYMWHIKEADMLDELALSLNSCIYKVSVENKSFGYIAHNPLPYTL